MSGIRDLNPEYLSTRYPQSTLLYGSQNAKPLLQTIRTPLENNTIVFIGSEGGFTEHEIRHLQSLHAVPVCISQNTLRIETAAVAFCALLKQI